MYINKIGESLEIANIKSGDMSLFLEDVNNAPFVIINEQGSIEIDKLKKESSDIAYVKQQWKIQRQSLVDDIEVTYNNVVYQGDETSQDRMSRAINGLPDDTTIINWKAKDNSTQALTRPELKEILFLAGQEQTKIWFN